MHECGLMGTKIKLDTINPQQMELGCNSRPPPMHHHMKCVTFAACLGTREQTKQNKFPECIYSS